MNDQVWFFQSFILRHKNKKFCMDSIAGMGIGPRTRILEILISGPARNPEFPFLNLKNPEKDFCYRHTILRFKNFRTPYAKSFPNVLQFKKWWFDRWQRISQLAEPTQILIFCKNKAWCNCNLNFVFDDYFYLLFLPEFI